MTTQSITQSILQPTKPLREFNIFGPTYPEEHYHVNRVAVKAALAEKIVKGRYLTLNAGRQTGKTTLFGEIFQELAATGEYFGILLDFEVLRGLTTIDFYEQLSKILATWRKAYAPEVPMPDGMSHHGDFVEWLEKTIEKRGKKCVLIIDEFDAIDSEIVTPMLSAFRGMYTQRKKYPAPVPHSIILVGVRNISYMLGGTQSPFNIADQFTVPYFSPAEVADLLNQYTQETGQAFEAEVIESIVQETAGQPFLVNRLGQILTQEIATDRSKSITASDLRYALTLLLTENNAHFYSIVDKATPHRQMLMPMLLQNQIRTNFLDSVTQELIMYNVLRVFQNERKLRYASISNPIYRKMLLLRFITPPEAMPVNGGMLHRYIVDGVLNFDGLLDQFKAFMTAHGVRLLKSTQTQRPLEISGQYLLLSYLSAALNNIQGQVTIESVSSAGEMDLLAFCEGQQFVVETKIWNGNAKYEASKKQLLDYLRVLGLHKGYLVIFDEALQSNPLLTNAEEVFEVPIDDVVLRVYLIGVVV